MSDCLTARLLLLSIVCAIITAPIARADTNCPQPGQWVLPQASAVTTATVGEVMKQAANADYVLLGEAHNNRAHHLWQLQSLAMLLGSGRELVIGMEMFPRRVQPILDRWVAGELTQEQFLQQSDWYRVWRFDPELYLPILHFARLNRIRLVALNVERELVAETRKRGWSAIGPELREGVTDPVPATQAYRDRLRLSFEQHAKLAEANFDFFVQAQLVWDRAFAQALADARATSPGAVVTALIGSEHLRSGHGVPRQLRALGENRVSVWLPLKPMSDCAEIEGIADAAFGAQNLASAAPPRLGVFLVDKDGETHIEEIMPGSVAEAAGLAARDRIVSAAGLPVHETSDVVAVVQRMLPGTWLPLTIERNGETIEIVARFPTDDKDGGEHGSPDETEKP